jgi:hypothetical protein
VESDFDGIVLNGNRYRAIGLPKRKTKAEKAKKIYDTKKIISESPKLAEAMTELCRQSPGLFWGYPVNSAGGRIGGSPDWQQNQKIQKCKQCGKSMALIVQLELGTASVYLFSCRTHQTETASLFQLD